MNDGEFAASVFLVFAVPLGALLIGWMLYRAFRKPRCKARLKRGADPKFHGRCELTDGHYVDLWEDHHLLNRGHIKVRWTETGLIRYEQETT